MKMPTAVVRMRVQWKPGEPVSYPYGGGSVLSEDLRLPLVVASSGEHSPAVPRIHFGSSGNSSRERQEEAGEGTGVGVGVGAASSSAPPTGKRFPILGPTRQETEMYFRRRRGRRSAKERMRSESRPLVTRSADIVLPPDLTSTTVRPSNITSSTTATTTTSITTTSTPVCSSGEKSLTTNNVHSHRGPRPGDSDQPHQRPRCDGPYLTTLPSNHTENGRSQSVTPVLPGFERLASSQGAPARSSPAAERLENSPTAVGPTLPFPAFEHSQSQQQAVGHRGSQTNGNKKTDAPMRFLPDSGPPVRAPELIQRGAVRTQREQHQKTLQPSKHGFHRRSKSPTFKCLVQAAEKLHDVVPDSHSDSHHADKCHLYHHHPPRSPPCAGVRLPAVVGVWDGAEEAGDAGTDGYDDGGTYLYPHEFLCSLPHSTYRLQHSGSAISTTTTKGKQTRTIGTSTASLRSRRGLLLPHGADHPDDVVVVGGDPDLARDWGAWEVDSLGADSGVTVPHGLPSSGDSHTELHLFLPRLADTASEDGSSPDRYRTRLPHHPPSERGAKGVMPPVLPLTQPRPSHTLPQQAQWAGERGGRPQTRRFTSPVRAVKRDRTPKRRTTTNNVVTAAPAPEVYESYEPYIKGEHLKEKLEDFPTLISLEQD